MNLILFSIINLIHFNLKPACKCPPISVDDNFNNSKAVFSGKVINIDTIRYTIGNIEKGHFYESQLVNVLKKETFKGNLSCDTVRIMTGIGGGDCGYNFELNTSYLIYANEQEYNLIDSVKPNGQYVTKNLKILNTSTCDRTTDSVNVEKSKIQIFLRRQSKHGTKR